MSAFRVGENYDKVTSTLSESQIWSETSEKLGLKPKFLNHWLKTLHPSWTVKVKKLFIPVEVTVKTHII